MSFSSMALVTDMYLPRDNCIKPKVTKLYYKRTKNHPEWSVLAHKFPNLTDLELTHYGNQACRMPDAELFNSFPMLKSLRGLGLELYPMYNPSAHAEALYHLTLIDAEGETLPPWVNAIPNLGKLTLIRANIASLDALSKLDCISNVTLELHSYGSPYDLPIPSLACFLKAPALRKVKIELSPLAQDINYLAPLACLIDLPSHVELTLTVFSRIARSDELNKLFGILKEAQLTAEQRRHYWLLLLATRKPKKLPVDMLDARFHLTFMEAKFNPVKVQAQTWLRSRAQTDVARRALGTDSVLFICGKSGFKATELKAKASELGFIISKTLDSKVTHILLGSNPKQTAAIDVEQHLIIDDTVLAQWFSSDAPKFLQQQSAAPMQANVLDMLRSGDEANHLVAATMLEQGGITSDMLLPLFLILKTTDNKALRKQIQALLAGHGDNAFQMAVQDKMFFNSKIRGLNKHGDPQGEGPVYKKLKGLSKRWGKALCDEFSLLYFNRFAEGLLWLLSQKEPSAIRNQAIAALVEGDRLNWHRGCGYERMLTQGDNHRRVMCYINPNFYLRRDELYNVTTPLPTDLPSKTRITELDLHNCVLGELPDNIMHYVDVTVLNLHFNHLRGLPASLAALSNIKDLDLSYNHLYEFPAVLFKLTKLQRLNLRQASRGHPIRAPQAFRDAMPNCVILEDQHAKSTAS